MRVGVVCEGPTDYYAIKEFFGNSLQNVGINCQFEALQPQVDNSKPEGGWANVLLWLKKNPPRARIQKYFGGGLFADEMGFEPLDCILIQLDTDILDDEKFRVFIDRELGRVVTVPPTSTAKRVSD